MFHRLLWRGPLCRRGETGQPSLQSIAFQRQAAEIGDSIVGLHLPCRPQSFGRHHPVQGRRRPELSAPKTFLPPDTDLIPPGGQSLRPEAQRLSGAQREIGIAQNRDPLVVTPLRAPPSGQIPQGPVHAHWCGLKSGAGEPEYRDPPLGQTLLYPGIVHAEQFGNCTPHKAAESAAAVRKASRNSVDCRCLAARGQLQIIKP